MLYSVALILISALSFLSFGDPKTPAEVFQEAAEFEKKGDFKKAAELYLLISENDTSYIESLSKLMSVYNSVKEYSKSIEIGLKYKDELTPFRKTFFILLGNAYLDSGLGKESLEIYQQGLDLFPYNYILLYNLGVAHYTIKDYESATSYFQKTLRFNPYYTRAHQMLGYVAMLQGYKTKAILSYYTLLAISPSNNKALVFLENLVKNNLREEGTIKISQNNIAFEYYDNLIRSKAAIDERFKQEVGFNANIVKQSELLLSKLEYKPNTDDFWMDFYVPIYSDINSEDLSTSFIYFILSSVNDDGIKEYLDKNEKEKSEWVAIANGYLQKSRANNTINLSGQTLDLHCWYYKNNSLSAVGNEKSDDTNVGDWIYFHPNGQISSYGEYNETGKKTGTWNYFHTNGQPARIEEYNEDGIMEGDVATYFAMDGSVSIKVNYKNNEPNGLANYYFNCGQLKERIPYKNGNIEGSGDIFYPSGNLKTKYSINGNKLMEEYTTYHVNGVVQEQRHYDNEGLLSGEYTSFYVDGSPNEAGLYKNDSLDGSWIGYHPNGSVSFKGSFEKGKRVGKWLDYSFNEGIIEDHTYNKSGELNGLSYYYSKNGLKHYTESYIDGLLTGYEYFDQAGNSIAKFSDPAGNMPLQTYFKNGKLKTKAQLVNGKIKGLFKVYSTSGLLSKETSLVDGAMNGPYVEYYPTGQKKLECTYKNGALEGAYTQFYTNGKVSQKGLYIDDQPEQEWKLYHPDGSLDEDRYYIGGKLNGWLNSYAPNGKKHTSQKFDMDKLVAQVLYDSLGRVYNRSTLNGGSGILARVTISGDTLSTKTLHCGETNSDILKYYPNGTLEGSYQIQSTYFHGRVVANNSDNSSQLVGRYKNDLRDSIWTYYHSNGNTKTIQHYTRGKIEGTTKAYHYNGKISIESNYTNDELFGPRKYYDIEGNLQLVKIYDEELGFVSYINNQTSDTIPFDNEGHFRLTTYFDNGNTAVEQNFLNGFFEGRASYYNYDGSLSRIVDFKAGDYHGELIEYYSDGTVYRESEYTIDLLNGINKEYYPNGQLKRVTPYINDNKHGVEVLYNLDGSIKQQTLYYNDFAY